MLVSKFFAWSRKASRSVSLVFIACAAAVALSTGARAAETALASHVPLAVSSGQAARKSALSTEQHLKLVLSLPVADQAGLDDLLKQIYDPASAKYHHYLSVAEYTARFAPAQADYDAVVEWAEANGFRVLGTVPNRRLVDVDGSVEVINHALHVTMGVYQHPTEARRFFAPDREPTFDLAVKLLQVSGLDNFRLPHTQLKRGSASAVSNAIAHATGSGPSGEYLPSDMRAAYYGSGSLTGSGQSIGIFSFDGYKTSDVTLYKTSTGMTFSTPIKNVLVNGYSGVCDGGDGSGTTPCDDGEQVLDIVNAIGMAPGITQVVFYEGSSATDILNRMVTDNVAKVLSCSWGGGDFSDTADDPIYQEMAAQGQTFANATGDSGAYNSPTWDPPSADPNLLEVGGTDLTTAGAGGVWSSETGWLDSGGGFISASGESTPSYQKLAGVITTTNKGSTTYRNDPDVAAEANFDNPTASNGSFETGYGGTSFAAPRWAGFLALVNQQSVANGKGTVGFVNPALYNLGVGAAGDYHDITSGNNKPSAGSGAGFNATAGYDLVTGWGSPNGATLINALAGSSTAKADFSLSASPSTVSVVQGASGTSTITLQDLNGFTGSAALTASGLPTGVTAAFSPASVTTTSKLTLTVSSTAATGSYTVTVKGVSGSLSHTASVSLTITATGGGGTTELLGNTGFESGVAKPWTLSSGVLCSNSTCSGETAHAGSWFAWLDGYGTTHTDTASQAVAIPSGKTVATLSYYLHIDTAEFTTETAYDTLKVQVLNSSGAVLATLATYSNLNAATGYTLHTSNVAAYIGQTVTIKFTGVEDASLQTSFVLDDVTLTVH